MLYSLFVLVFGIYLGQEYTIPNIRLIGIHLLQTIESLQNEDRNIQQAEQKSFSIFDIFK
jgi:hypothetical protein